MDDRKIIEALDVVQTLSAQVAMRVLSARQKGRMLSLDEARELDEISLRLLQNVELLSGMQPGQIEYPDLRLKASELLEHARESLGMVVKEKAMSDEIRRRPSAAPERLTQYCSY